MSPVPVLLVCSLDPVLRTAVTTGLLLDVPGAVVVRHDLDRAAGVLHRQVHDRLGVLETGALLLDGGCVSCALRDDLLPALRRVACREPSAVVLALPLTAEPLPLLRMVARTGAALRLGAVLTAVDTATFEDDLFGDALLDEVGLAMSPADRRAVGEVLARQVECADAVIATTPARGRTERLLRHVGSALVRVSDLHSPVATDLLAVCRDDSDRRGDLRRPEPSGWADGDGVWTLDLASWRPLHPVRLLDALEKLGGGRTRGRGHFWLPTRPDDPCGWDGGGGQLRVGPLGRWEGRLASTRLVVTGVDGDPRRLRTTFDGALATDIELARGLSWWAGREDGFDPWLGPLRASA